MLHQSQGGLGELGNELSRMQAPRLPVAKVPSSRESQDKKKGSQRKGMCVRVRVYRVFMCYVAGCLKPYELAPSLWLGC